MIEFKNLECNAEPETTMFQQEIDVLLAVIRETLDVIAPQAAKGTFILDGQKFGEDAKCILRFNLPGGTYYRNFFRIQERSSDMLAEDAIDELLALPRKSRYVSDKPDLKRHITSKQATSGNPVSSGIYQDGELKVLVLNAVHGRFLVSCYLENHDDEAEALLYAVAQAILQMGLEDKVLQSFGQQIVAAGECSERKEFFVEAFVTVTDLFHRCEAPEELQAWKAWHEPANAAGQLTLFFE